MIIKRATIKDFKDIANIEFNNGYIWSKYTFEEELKYAKLLLENRKQFVFIAIIKDKAIGYVSLGIEKRAGDIGISVLKKHQGKGIGRELLKYIIEIGRKKKCQKLELDVWEKNKIISLYKKLGFTIISEKKNYYENGDSLLHFELDL